MTNLATRRINIEDLPGSPAWMPTLLNPLNQNFSDMQALVNGQLEIGANLRGQVATVQFTTPADYATGGFVPISIKVTSKFQPKSLLIGQITCTSPAEPILTATSLQWQYVNSVAPAQIKITYVAGLKASQTYSLTVLAL